MGEEHCKKGARNPVPSGKCILRIERSAALSEAEGAEIRRKLEEGLEELMPLPH
jgi:hypothetical protein